MRALRLALSIATFAACAAHARPARADEAADPSPAPAPAPAPEPAPSPGAPQWYGWQILLPDAVAAALLGAAIAAGGDGAMTPAVLGTFLYLFAGPGTHASHGDGGRAGGSFALRLGLPLACGLIGDALAPPYSVDPAGDNKTHPGLIPGFLVGMSVASAIDITALAWTRAPATDAKAASSWVLLPSATMSRDKAGRQVPTFGVSGAF